MVLTPSLTFHDTPLQCTQLKVFNKGFRKMLGDIDASALVAQYVGGWAGMGRGGGDADAEGENEDAAVDSDGYDGAGAGVAADLPRNVNRKKLKGKVKRREMDARRDRQLQRQLAADGGLAMFE